MSITRIVLQSIERELSEREEQLGTLISDQTRLQAELDSGRKAETLEKENLNKLQIRIASLSSDIEKNQNDIQGNSRKPCIHKSSDPEVRYYDGTDPGAEIRTEPEIFWCAK